jgi:hypothetical protein
MHDPGCMLLSCDSVDAHGDNIFMYLERKDKLMLAKAKCFNGDLPPMDSATLFLPGIF